MLLVRRLFINSDTEKLVLHNLYSQILQYLSLNILLSNISKTRNTKITTELVIQNTTEYNQNCGKRIGTELKTNLIEQKYFSNFYSPLNLKIQSWE